MASMMPTINPEKKPTNKAGVGHWLQCCCAFGASLDFEALMATAEPELFAVGAADLAAADDAGDEVPPGCDEVGLGEVVAVGELDWDRVHWLDPTQFMPAGQQRSPHFSSVVVKSVEKSWLKG